MSLLVAFSWPYSGQAKIESKNFFDKVKLNMNSFPYKNNEHEIALVESDSNTHFVGFLVFTNYPGDDSIIISDSIINWLRGYDNNNYQENESVRIRGNSIEESLGQGYTILDSIKDSKVSNVNENKEDSKKSKKRKPQLKTLLKELKKINEVPYTSVNIEESNNIKESLVESCKGEIKMLKTEIDDFINNKQSKYYQYAADLLDCIGQIRGDEAFNYLIYLLNINNRNQGFDRIIYGAVIGLKKINDKRCIEQLTEALKRKNDNYVLKAINEVLLFYGAINNSQFLEICKKCYKNKGIQTIFYYGKEVEISRQNYFDMGPGGGSGAKITKRTTYEGSHETFICKKCLRKFILNKCSLYLLGFALSLFISILLFQGDDNSWLGIIPLFFAIIALVMFVKNLTDKQEIREELAIESFSSKYSNSKNGYNKFWTTSAFEEFRKECSK